MRITDVSLFAFWDFFVGGAGLAPVWALERR